MNSGLREPACRRQYNETVARRKHFHLKSIVSNEIYRVFNPGDYLWSNLI